MSEGSPHLVPYLSRQGVLDLGRASSGKVLLPIENGQWTSKYEPISDALH